MRRKRPWVLGGILTLIAGGGVAFAVVSAQKNGPVPVPSATSTTTSPSDVPSGSEEWSTKFGIEPVNVTITASPSNAAIFLDEQRLSANPYSAKHPKGGRHKILVTAPGYLPHVQESGFDTNLYVTVTLELEPEGGIMMPAPVITRHPRVAPVAARDAAAAPSAAPNSKVDAGRP